MRFKSNFIVYISPFDLFSVVIFFSRRKYCTCQTKHQSFDKSTMDRMMGQTTHANGRQIGTQKHYKVFTFTAKSFFFLLRKRASSQCSSWIFRNFFIQRWHEAGKRRKRNFLKGLMEFYYGPKSMEWIKNGRSGKNTKIAPKSHKKLPNSKKKNCNWHFIPPNLISIAFKCISSAKSFDCNIFDACCRC